ncbi:MAG TPA: hypothetical protein ENK10_09205 [Acidobacteria bacterium]|nr:hypothetical protein [Acidobacteriota bacterium]
MPRPASGTTIQRPDLGALMYEYFMSLDRQGFVGRALLPVFEVGDQSGDYPVIPIEQILKVPADGGRRAPRQAYGRDDFEFETGTFSCKEYGREAPLDDVEAKLYARFFDAEEVAARRATLKLALLYELRCKSLLFNTSTFANAAVAAAWSSAATATPLTDVVNAKAAMRSSYGIEPNVIVMAKPVFDKLMLTDEINNTFKYTNPIQSLSREAKRRLAAQYFEVDDVLVAGGMYDAAKKGQAASLSEIWGTGYVGLFRVADSETRDLEEPVVGRTFLWTDDSPEMFTTEQYREEQTRSNIYRVRHHTDERLVYAGAGYLLTGVTA